MPPKRTIKGAIRGQPFNFWRGVGWFGIGMNFFFNPLIPHGFFSWGMCLHDIFFSLQRSAWNFFCVWMGLVGLHYKFNFDQIYKFLSKSFWLTFIIQYINLNTECKTLRWPLPTVKRSQACFWTFASTKWGHSATEQYIAKRECPYSAYLQEDNEPHPFLVISKLRTTSTAISCFRELSRKG